MSWSCPTLVSTAEAPAAERVSWPISLTDIGDTFDELLALLEDEGVAGASAYLIEGWEALKNLKRDSCPILCFLGEKCVSCSKKGTLKKGMRRVSQKRQFLK